MQGQNLHSPHGSRDDLDVANRDEIVMVRLTADEKKAWQAAADANQRKLADWVRVIVSAQLQTAPRLATAAKSRKKGGK